MTHSNSFVSVVIPTFNRDRKISAAVQSVLDQTYGNFEIVVVDDGSDCETGNIIKSISDSRIKYIRHEKNLGVSAARNTGIRSSKGDYIAFLDDDDIWLPNKLIKQLNCGCIDNAQPDVIYTQSCRYEKGTMKTIPSGKETVLEGNIYHALLMRNYITMPSVLLRKTCLEKSGLFDENIRVFEDWDFLLRLSKNFNFKFIAEPLVIVHQSSGSLLSRVDDMQNGLKAIMLNNLPEIETDAELKARFLAYFGHLSCLVGDVKQGREYILRAAKMRPFNVGYSAGYLISFVGKAFYCRVSKRYLNHAGRN